MKGVNNKVKTNERRGNLAAGKREQKGPRGKKRAARVLTASDLAATNSRLDQCLPMETMEWQRVEQLLMQLSEFAPNSLVYEAGMAVALYADEQARRAYMLGAEDGEARAESLAQPQIRAVRGA